MRFVALFLASVAVSLACTYSLRELGRCLPLQRVNAPDGMHRWKLPRLGGLALFTSVLIGLAIAQVLGMCTIDRKVIGLIGGGSVILGVGVLDDFLSLSPVAKMLGQLTSAVVLVLASYAGGTGRLSFGTCTTAALIVLVLTNASNLIDGLDGLCAGISLLTMCVILVAALSCKAQVTTVVTLILCGSTLGFLRFNLYPASIILGDCGSLFIGFVIAAGIIDVSNSRTGARLFMLPLIAYALPVAEVAYSIIRRTAARSPVFKPDRGHIHYRLEQFGFGHVGAVIALCAASSILAITCLLALVQPALLLVWLTGISASIPILLRRLCCMESGTAGSMPRSALDAAASGFDCPVSPQQS